MTGNVHATKSSLNGFVTLDVQAGTELACDESGMGVKTSESAPVRWRFANAEYNERHHELMVAGTAVALEPKPLEVLLCLLRAEGELVTKQELFDTVWAGRVVTDGVLSQAIFRIREVLGDAERNMLRTVHGYGFRLDVPIEIEGRDDPGTRLELEAGQSLPNLPHWILEERLQTRPANELWRIRHAQNQQRRVVKLALDERAQRALKREVTLNKVLRAELGNSAPLVPLLEWQFDSSPAWIQMPWYEQGSLADWLEAQGGPAQLDLPRRMRIVAEAAEALAQAHQLGVMHKDIKPGNLLVEHTGDEPRLLLCDFGSGTVKSRERLEQTGVTVMGFTKTVRPDSSTSGTPAYMAPEVLKGGVFSEQSDVYAVGVLLYQLVVGDLNEPLAPGWEEDVADAGLRSIIAGACAGKPARRFASMDELAQRLRAWQPGAPVPAQAPRPRRPGRTVLTAAAVLVVCALTLGLWPDRPPGVMPGASDAALIPEAPIEQRVALLAFDLLGLDAQTRTVMGGLQDALMADLASLAGVRLVDGQNLARLGLADAPAAQIGRALKASQLIRGSVQQLGEQLRVSLQIVDTAGGETIWGQAIEGTRANLFAVQADIARELATALGTSLSAVAGRPLNNEAYEAYLAALAQWKQGKGDEEELSRNLERALALEPQFIDAHLLALLKAARDYWFSNTTRSDAQARIAAHLSTLEAQDTPPVKIATARAVRRYYLDHDPRGGVEILAPFQRTLIRNTESALFYAFMLRRIGRSDEAFEILDQVIDRDPSAPVPVETKAELLAFLGRGAEAAELLLEAQRRFPGQTHVPLKIAMFGYRLTGDLRFVEFGREAMAQDASYAKKRHMAELEMARRQNDLPTVRELARNSGAEDGTESGHGRMPRELDMALALRAGAAEAEEVRSLAERALERLQAWRAESDSDSRRGTMALTLALLGRGDEALALNAQVEAAYPLERDQLEAANHLLTATTMHALLGNGTAVLDRLQILASSKFVSMNLCTVPMSYQHDAISQLPAAEAFINEQCAPHWDRNQREMTPLLDQLQAHEARQAGHAGAAT